MDLEALSSFDFAWVQTEAFVAIFYFMCVVVAARGFSSGPGPS